MQEMPSKLPGIKEDIKYLNLKILELLHKKKTVKLFFPSQKRVSGFCIRLLDYYHGEIIIIKSRILES